MAASAAPSCLCSPLRCLRAFLLYHYLPCDKGPWTKARDPVWWLLKLATLVPAYGVRVGLHALLLLLLVAPSKHMDEFQLVQFALGFKGTQFLSGGLLLALQGGVALFQITTFEEDGGAPLSERLSSEAPGVGEGLFLEVSLTTLGVHLLLCSWLRTKLWKRNI